MQDFQIPEPFLAKLYELSGGADKYKGFILFCVDSKGEPRSIMSRMDSATRMCLRKQAEIWLSALNDGDAIGSNFDDDDE